MTSLPAWITVWGSEIIFLYLQAWWKSMCYLWYHQAPTCILWVAFLLNHLSILQYVVSAPKLANSVSVAQWLEYLIWSSEGSRFNPCLGLRDQCLNICTWQTLLFKMLCCTILTKPVTNNLLLVNCHFDLITKEHNFVQGNRLQTYCSNFVTVASHFIFWL